MKILHQQRGDTIVEVLISLTVIAMVLAGAYVVSATSSRNVRSSQEHSQALQLLQGQVEQLRAYAANNSHAQLVTDSSNNAFCLNNGAIAKKQTDTDCKPDANSLYSYSIQADPAVACSGTVCQYIATITWDALGGGTNQEQLLYRVRFQS